jgi:mannose-6-phosphate isomerase-like protein (cupin superfamily)
MPLVPQAMPSQGFSTLALREKLEELSAHKGPTVFKLRTQMLAEGRSHIGLAATKDLSVVIKVYASGGENALHQHAHEDHVFFCLQGGAQFYGIDGPMTELHAFEGVMLPKGTLYRFHAIEGEPLVLLRVGTPNYALNPNPARTLPDGTYIQGDSKENKTVPARVIEGAFFG